MIDLERNGLPSDTFAERAILGGLMMDWTAYQGTFELIPIDKFYSEKHQRIFAAMKALEKENRPIDRVTVANELTERKHLESIGGLSYLVDLNAGLPDGFNIERSIDRVIETAALREIIVVAHATEQRCLSGTDKAAEISAWAEEKLAGVTDPRENPRVMTIGDVIARAGGINHFLDPAKRRGVPTPWNRLTEMTNGYRPGDLIVVAGNTSMGKTSYALQVAMKVAAAGYGVMIFSLEMSADELVMRMLSARSGVNFQDIRGGFLNKTERELIVRQGSEIQQWPTEISERGTEGLEVAVIPG